jgi:hypothetical protein
LAVEPLGRQVGGGAEHRAGGGQLGHVLGALGDAEVDHLPVIAGPQDVAGLDVAVDHPGPVGGAEGGEDLQRHRAGGRRRHRTVAQDVGQRRPGQALHDHVRHLVVLARVEHRHHVGVAEPGRRPGLGLEPAPDRGLAGQVGEQELDRHPPSQPAVLGGPHLAHPAPAEQALELVAVGENARGALGGHGANDTGVGGTGYRRRHAARGQSRGREGQG